MTTDQDMQSLPLTFGAELELGISCRGKPSLDQLIASCGNRVEAERKHTLAAAEAHLEIVNRLNEPRVGLHARLARDAQPPINLHRARATAGTTAATAARYGCWEVEGDASLDFRVEERAVGHMITPVEIKTPVFTADPYDVATADAAADDDDPATYADMLSSCIPAATHRGLVTALDAVRERFGATVINRDCGVHVHVGSVRPDGRRGFELATLRAFATLVTCCERALNQLHPDVRQGDNMYCRPPSRVHNLTGVMRRQLQRLEKLWRAPNYPVLHWLFNDGRGRYYAYNFANIQVSPEEALDPFGGNTNPAASSSSINRNLSGNDDDNDDDDDDDDGWEDADLRPVRSSPAPKQPLQTIGFRQHAASLDPARIAAWAAVACRLVAVAHRFRRAATPAPMLAHVLRFAEPARDVSAHDVLRGLGLAPLIPLFPLHDHTLRVAGFPRGLSPLWSSSSSSAAAASTSGTASSQSRSLESFLRFMKMDLLTQARLKVPALGGPMHACLARTMPAVLARLPKLCPCTTCSSIRRRRRRRRARGEEREVVELDDSDDDGDDNHNGAALASSTLPPSAAWPRRPLSIRSVSTVHPSLEPLGPSLAASPVTSSTGSLTVRPSTSACPSNSSSRPPQAFRRSPNG